MIGFNYPSLVVMMLLESRFSNITVNLYRVACVMTISLYHMVGYPFSLEYRGCMIISLYANGQELHLSSQCTVFKRI